MHQAAREQARLPPCLPRGPTCDGEQLALVVEGGDLRGAGEGEGQAHQCAAAAQLLRGVGGVVCGMWRPAGGWVDGRQGGALPGMHAGGPWPSRSTHLQVQEEVLADDAHAKTHHHGLPDEHQHRWGGQHLAQPHPVLHLLLLLLLLGPALMQPLLAAPCMLLLLLPLLAG
jgi:hypothetical protein